MACVPPGDDPSPESGDEPWFGITFADLICTAIGAAVLAWWLWAWTQ
jgi:hypothetical protein